MISATPKLPTELPAIAQASGTSVARLLNAGSAILSVAVLADSSLEHYRGSFFNRAMYTPLAISALTLGAALHGSSDKSPAAERRRDTIFALAAGTGVIGTGLHTYNITKREGGFSWHNLFYGAPLGAPFALLLAGALGVAAERVRDAKPGFARLFRLPAGRVLAALTSAGLLGTVGEVGLLHFRGAYQDPFMYLPVTLPPVAAGLLANAAVTPARRRPFARWWLRLTTALGLAGIGFHAWGVHRNMGGWRNWKQNVLNGPPLPAPPSFTGLGLAGLAALRLLEKP